MNNKQQTTVEWIEQEMLKGNLSMKEILEQGKEMEKERIEDAFGIGCQVESTRLIGYQDIAQQYYNETYGGKK
jgi:poly(3-hydroxyalkanoate) synthetase